MHILCIIEFYKGTKNNEKTQNFIIEFKRNQNEKATFISTVEAHRYDKYSVRIKPGNLKLEKKYSEI